MDDERKSHSLYDSNKPSARGHVASFGASIAAHAAIVAMIVCFASPVARRHSEWVLAYLVEGADGAPGRSGANAAAPEAAPDHAASVALATKRAAPPRAARKRRRRVEDARAEVASVPPVRPAALARPDASAYEDHAASHGDNQTVDARPAAAASGGSGANRGGAGSAGAADGGAGDDPNSIAHADYARNPPPVYPAAARRREQQGTVTVRVLIGADGSVERAEVAESSGFDSLDDAALDTVRSRWRFVPARHGGLAVESWVLVPIRFALIEANAAVR
ncbi:MAG TPA: energy transducer TonB [Verrucomicrobiae bacterium]|nr:energy transducer TonB [Verrucomicrobiae bacterium]